MSSSLKQVAVLLSLIFFYGLFTCHCAPMIKGFSLTTTSITVKMSEDKDYSFAFLNALHHYPPELRLGNHSRICESELTENDGPALPYEMMPKCDFEFMNGLKISFPLQKNKQILEYRVESHQPLTEFTNAGATSSPSETASHVLFSFNGKDFSILKNQQPDKFYFSHEVLLNQSHSVADGTIISFLCGDLKYWIHFEAKNLLTVLTVHKDLSVLPEKITEDSQSLQSNEDSSNFPSFENGSKPVVIGGIAVIILVAVLFMRRPSKHHPTSKSQSSHQKQSKKLFRKASLLKK